jgi:hypothetical protein
MSPPAPSYGEHDTDEDPDIDGNREPEPRDHFAFHTIWGLPPGKVRRSSVATISPAFSRVRIRGEIESRGTFTDLAISLQVA